MKQRETDLCPGGQTLPVLVSDWPGVQVRDELALVQQISSVVKSLPQQRVADQIEDVEGQHPGQDLHHLRVVKVVVRQI